MTWLFPLIRFGALFASLLGYVAFARAFLGVPVYFSYVFSLSVITLAMYFAGLAGVLATAAYVVFGLGFVLLLIVVLARRLAAAFPRPTLSLINVLFILWFWVAFASLINYRLIHYDNFSHWALVVKQMLVTDRIPDAASALIDFKNYPLGTSSLLYYVCKIVGRSEGVMLVGQLMLITACFYAFCGVMRDRKRFLLAALLGLGASIMSFFNISIRVNNLLVDYLLPLLSLAAIAGATESAKKYAVACLASVPVLGLLLVVKNTGVFFAMPAFLYLLYAGYPSRAHRRFSLRALTWLGGLLSIAAAFVPLLLWNAHVNATFAGETSKFNVSLSTLRTLDLTNLYAMIPDKTPEQVQSIISLFFQSVTSPQQLATQGILLVNLLAVVAWLNARFGFGLRWKLLRVLALCDVLMAVYYAGILAFYLVAMPTGEALRLAGFERYAASMVLFIIGALALCLTRDVERSLYVQQGEERDYRAFKSLTTKRIYQSATLAVFTVSMLFLTTDLYGMNALQEGYPNTLPAHAETVLGNQWAQGDANRYLLYAPDTDRQVTDDYLLYVGRYMLFTPGVQATAKTDGTLLDDVQGYDYFVIVETDPAIQAFMTANTGLTGDVGVYAVADTFKAAALSAPAP
jgi:hypothetical protein